MVRRIVITLLAFVDIPVGAFDYEEKYPEDPIYAECSPTARVWRAFIEESQKFDTEIVDDWRDTIDVLLVFVSRFSSQLMFLTIDYRLVCSLL